MNLLIQLLRFFTGAQARWTNGQAPRHQSIYFANHTSHLDIVLLWAVLPSDIRNKTMAVGAADYWTKTPLRRWLAERLFNAILIERKNITRKNNPITQLIRALDQGKSLIIFPEGGRCSDSETKTFKGGIYHLAKMRPKVDLIPVYIDNANRVLPKGELLPVPLICSVSFGTSLHLEDNEIKTVFLKRMQSAVEECSHI